MWENKNSNILINVPSNVIKKSIREANNGELCYELLKFGECSFLIKYHF